MIDLLKQYDLSNIIIFVILLALAIKGGVTFFDWAFDRTKKAVHKTEEPQNIKNNLEAHAKEIQELKDSINKLTDMVNLLIESDKDDIKAYITKQYHWFVYQQKWIDDYSLNCLEKRFGHYEVQGGNSFILGLMKELRQLPKQPPNQKEKCQISIDAGINRRPH